MIPGRGLLGCAGAGAATGVALLLGVIAAVGGVVGAAAQNTGTVGAGDQLKPGVIPEQYVELVHRAAGICPEITAPLIAAQIQEESGWDPQATSPVGAQGLTQFMPGTWSSSGVDGDGDGATDPFNPADAITSQGHYMCDQVAQINDSGLPGDVIDLALAAYNAGMGAVQQYGGIPPYAETQTYVRKIRKLAAELAVPALPPDGGAGGGWVTPAVGRCTSGFGPRWGDFHKGQDLAAPSGTPIVAAAAGTVIASGPASGYGLWVKIAHPDDTVTIYGHNHANHVAVGDQVAAGQPIAEVGNRGQSTGSHVHYQVEIGGQAVDPISHHQRVGAAPLCG